MQSATSKQEFYRIHAAYREAWRRLASKVEFWQLLVCMRSADELAIKVAEEEIRSAEHDYRAKRNLLAEFMLARSEQSPAADAKPCPELVMNHTFLQEQPPAI